MFKRNSFYIMAVLALAALSACEIDYRQKAKGSNREIIVVMDSTKWESETAQAIKDTYGKYIFTLPNPEQNYDLVFMDIRSRQQLEFIKSMRNIIFAAPIDDSSNVAAQIRSFLADDIEERVRAGESFAFPVKDEWYRDQYAIILTSTSDSALAAKIRVSEKALLNDVLEREMDRFAAEVYYKHEQTQLSDSLWDEHGFKIRIQHDYLHSVDTTNFVTYRRYLPENDRWIWVWWKNHAGGISYLDDEWINATRDSLMQIYIKGNSDDKYVTTEYRRPVVTDSFEKDGLTAYETLGTWRMENAAMGGPFVNFTYYDPRTDRLFMVEYMQFAPKVEKKIRFVRQFRAMGRTFVSDSTRTQ